MVKLTPMDAKDYAPYRERLIREYAAEHVANGNWTEAESLEKARQQTNELLPDGVRTKDQHLFSLVDESSGEKVGILWVRVKSDDPKRQAFIYDFIIEESLRGQGFGKQALTAMDVKLKEMGVQSVGLHVFGNNLTAQALYKKMGFEVTGIHMRKVYE